MNKRIGFLGTTKYDLILLSSFLLSKIQKRVLIVDDESDISALSCCIPVPRELDMNHSKITFRDIDYLKNQAIENGAKYDYTLISLRMDGHGIEQCDELILCLDLQRHRVKVANRLKLRDPYLIIRGIDYIQDSKKILDEIEFDVKNVMCIENDERNNSCLMELQYQEKLHLSHLTNDYRKILEELFYDVYGVSRGMYKLAYRRLRKRG